MNELSLLEKIMFNGWLPYDDEEAVKQEYERIMLEAFIREVIVVK